MKKFYTYVILNLCVVFSVGLSAQNLCTRATNIFCNNTILGTTGFESISLKKNYDCEITNFNGKERVYKFTATTTTKISIQLSINKVGRDLDLFLLNTCNFSVSTFSESAEGTCIASSVSPNTNSNKETIFAEVNQGSTYYIVIDSKIFAVADSFKLTLLCIPNICDRRNSLSCGESKTGEKITVDDFNGISTYPGCSNEMFEGKEKIYQIDLVNDFSVQIGLHVDTTSRDTFDMFLVSADECVEIKCLKRAEVSAIKGSKYITIQLGPGTYYIIVDSKKYYNYPTATFSINLACSEILCTKAPVLSCQSPSTGATGNARTNAVSVYRIPQSGGKDLYYPGHTGGEKTYTFEVYETQLVKIKLSQTVGSKTKDLNLFLLKSCDRLNAIAASVRKRTSVESIAMRLNPGVYYVVVDEFLNAEVVSFTLSIEFTQPCANVCMYAGSFISRGTTFSNELSISETAPVLLYTDQCVRDAFGGNLTRKKLYTDIFVFKNETEGEQINLTLSTTANAQNLRGFIMRCSATQATVCLGSTQNGVLDLGEMPAGFYYVVIVGTQTMPYTFAIIPNGACGANPEPIPVDKDTIINVTGQGSNYNVGDQNNTYGGCYNGARTYNGEDIELQFTIETSAKVDISFSSSSATGVFLYGATCGKGCLAFAETPANGGSGLISDFPLNPGTYYLIVDKNATTGSGACTLKVSTRFLVKDLFATVIDDTENCATSSQKFNHKVNIVKPNGDSTYTATDLISFYYGSPNGILRSQQSYWDENKAVRKMVFELKMDSIGVEPKCGYEEGEDIIMFMTRNGVGQQTTMDLKPTYAERSSSTGINAQQTFIKNGLSEIVNFDLVNPRSFKAADNQINVNSNKEEIYKIKFQSTLEFTVDIEPKVDYVSIVRPQSLYAAQAEEIEVKVTRNTTGQERKDVKVIFRSTSTPRLQEVVLIKQIQCLPITAKISNSLAGQTICEGSSIRLDASVVNSNTQNYSFKWSNGATNSFLDLKNIGVGASTYTVTVSSNNNSCLTQDDETIAITAQPKPGKPLAVGAELSACSDQVLPTLMVQPQTGASINWYNSAGNLLKSNAVEYTPPVRPAGEYIYYAGATSNVGCVNEERTPIKLTIHPKLTLSTPIVEQNVSCKGGRDGILNIKVNERFSSGITYLWSDQQQGARRTGARGGKYTATAMYASGCTQVFEAEIKEPDSIRIIVKSIKPDTSNKSVGKIEVEVIGGTPPYNFVWIKDGSIFDNSQNIAELSAGNYQLEVNDQNRCTRKSSIFLVRSVVTSTQEHPWSPLIQVFPNPTNGLINIAFDLPETVYVNAEIINGLGETILKLSPRNIAQGTLQTNLANYGSGIYLIRVSVPDGQVFKKILLTR